MDAYVLTGYGRLASPGGQSWGAWGLPDCAEWTYQDCWYLESEGNQQQSNDKFNRVDIKAKNSKGEIIMVRYRTQVNCITWSVCSGVAKAITEHINLGNDRRGEEYIHQHLYFDLGKGSDYIYVGQNNSVGLHTQEPPDHQHKEKDTIVRKSPWEISPTYILVELMNSIRWLNHHWKNGLNTWKME